MARPGHKTLSLIALLALAACGGSEEPAPDAAPQRPTAQGAAEPEPDDGLQAMSLFGEELYQQEDTTGAIAEADAMLRERPTTCST